MHFSPHPKTRFTFSLLLLGVLLCSNVSTQVVKSSQPDIILIVADDLGWGDLGCYGAEDVLTPKLDALAAGGQKWSQFYANCCVCSPTRASILSGCYPDRVGVPGVIRTANTNSWGKLAPVPLLPEHLSRFGYQTACVGKWHLGLYSGDHPMDRGFMRFDGFLGDMMDDYFNHRRHGENYIRHNRTETNPAGHATALFTNWAIRAIQEFAATEQPYFLYLAYNAPHTPIQPPTDALSKVLGRMPKLEPQRANLVALIEDMDWHIGKLLAAVKQYERDTLIVFVSDNGGQSEVGAQNGPLRGGKQSMYEGGLRIPAIVNWPGHVAPGSECHRIGVTMDLLPSICECAGGIAPPEIDGMSLTPWINEPTQVQAEREIYYTRREGGPQYAGLSIEALRQGDWKLVHNFPTQAFELFNLAKDPQEQVDLSNVEPQKLRQLIARLQHHIQRGAQVPWQ
ncbi:MAG: sulfatase-like hydrolase/transferase [Planctomycetales bacterium]|nr:sulfatase-like hydrolase/transferase [Planctomycetales bacterium]